MVRETKKQFLAKPKNAGLPKAEQNRRWRQHVRSESTGKTNKLNSANTNVAPKGKPKEHTLDSFRAHEIACVRDYAQALANPFDCPPTCLPYLPPLPSRKVKYWARGSLLTQSSNGFGWIVAQPAFSNVSTVCVVSDGSGTGTITKTSGAGTAQHLLNSRS